MSTDKKAVTQTEEPFLSRWARVKQSNNAPETAVAASPLAGITPMPNSSIDAPLEAKMPEDARPEPTLPDETAPVSLPALDSLTPQSDFSPFMAKDVDPRLRNLAMKKLFTDPHYNVMDRMDIYIDDYSTHAPLPLDVVRQMSISKAMRLFADEEDKEGAAKIAAATSTPPILTQAVADVQPTQVVVETPATLEPEACNGAITDQPPA